VQRASIGWMPNWDDDNHLFIACQLYRLLDRRGVYASRDHSPEPKCDGFEQQILARETRFVVAPGTVSHS